jgi:hypothetical protein
MLIHGFTSGGIVQPQYAAWTNMRQRCHNPNHPRFPDYGGRGITVSEDWRRSFPKFHDEMGPRPSPQHTLDRIDNDGPYASGNCRWADTATQRRNSRSAHTATISGITSCVADLASRFGMPRHTVYSRLRRGWSLADALTRPIQRKKSRASKQVNIHREEDE